MIYTFYSYKGGVGRSMALVNVAELMYRAGQNVIMVDWDLEAPGLEKFYPELSEQVLNKPGIIDLLVSYKEKAAHYRPESSTPLFSPDDVSSLLIDMHPGEATGSKLWLLPAGRRARAQFVDYANRVKSFDWQDFYQNWEGEVYLEWLRQQFANLANAVLIDARTGVTEMGGVTTYQLADAVVMLCTANQQNLEGTQQMVESFSNPTLPKLRHGRELKVLVIPSRIERLSETIPLNRFREDFARRFQRYFLDFQWTETLSLVDLEIPYIPLYAFEERIAVTSRDVEARSVELEEAYTRLYQFLSQGEVSGMDKALQLETVINLDLVIDRTTEAGPINVATSSRLGTAKTRVRGALPTFQFQYGSPSSEQARTIGREMFRSFFTEELWGIYRECRRFAERNRQGLRITIDARDQSVAELPWELLFDDDREEFLALSQRTSLVRLIKSSSHSFPPAAIGPLRILGIGASPSNLPKIDLDGEQMRIQSSVADLVNAGLAELNWVRDQNVSELQRTLQKGPWHVLHYTGVGGLGTEGEGQIFLTDKNGRAQLVNTKQLELLLADAPSLRLVVLNCSASATNTGKNPNSNIAASLVRSGIPAAIGMQFDVSDVAALEFSGSFYRAIAAHNPIEIALTDARRSMSLIAERYAEWAAPVLYSRQIDNDLIRLDRSPPHTTGG